MQTQDPLADLPGGLSVLHTRPLFVMRLDVRPILAIGAAPGEAQRRLGAVYGGSFAGDRLAGVVLDGGNDWQSVRADGTVMLDVRLALKAEDGSLIGMTYRGLRAASPEIALRIDRGEEVEPGSYYFRIAPLFETAAPDLDWLNRIIAVGVGHRTAAGPVYSVFEVQ